MVTTQPDVLLEPHRAAVTRHCYRMLGSAFDAEDAAQDTLVRAWRNLERLHDQQALLGWLYRIATNVCLDRLTGKEARLRPTDFDARGDGFGPLPDALPEATWVLPMPDARMFGADPAEAAAGRESVRLAFVAALQHLPPKQRAVLVLREVLGWSAQEVAELLDTSVASVNSALQRARATLDAKVIATDTWSPLAPDQQALLDRYVRAFEAYDLDQLVPLLAEDATLSMPPYSLWMRGHDDIRRWLGGMGIGCRGSRLIPTVANGSPAFGQYRPSGPSGAHEPWALQVLELRGGGIVALNVFLDVQRLFPLFGLPPAP